jgi:hypothetical protein
MNLYDFIEQENKIVVQYQDSFDRFFDFANNNTLLDNYNISGAVAVQSIIDDYITHRKDSFDGTSAVISSDFSSLTLTVPPFFDFPQYMSSYKNLTSKTINVGVSVPYYFTEKGFFYPNHSVPITISSVTSTRKYTDLSSLFAPSSDASTSCDSLNMFTLTMLFNATALRFPDLYWTLYQKNNQTKSFKAGDYNGFTFCLDLGVTYVLTTFDAQNSRGGNSSLNFQMGFRKGNRAYKYSFDSIQNYSLDTEFMMSSSTSEPSIGSSSGTLATVTIPSSATPKKDYIVVIVVVVVVIVILSVVGFAIYWKKYRSNTAGRIRVDSNAQTARKTTEIAVVPDGTTRKQFSSIQ